MDKKYKDLGKLSKIAYSDNIERQINELGYRLITFNSINEVDYFICEKNNIQYIVFRGSESPKVNFSNIQDWLTNLDFDFKEIKGIKFHEGFLKAVLSVYNHIFDKIDLKKEIIVTGHSQGASLAGIFQMVLYMKTKKKIVSIDFSPSRITNSKGLKFFNKAGLQRDWYSLGIGIVKFLPLYSQGYRHTGNFHYITPKGKIIVNPNIWYRIKTNFKEFIKKPNAIITDHDITLVNKYYEKEA